MTSLEVYTRHKYAFILAIILIGLVHDVRCVTYQLSAVPENVAIGQTLTITAKLAGPFIDGANTDLRIMLQQPGQQTVSIFQYRTVTGCIFQVEPYISTGTVVTCEPANSRYVIRFPSVTAAHVGLYKLSAPRELPANSADAGVTANVQLLVAPTSVTVTPTRREVLEGQATNFVCTVDNQATIPVSFVWKRIVNGNRVNPPAASTTTMIVGGRGNRLEWNSVSRQHAGKYECTASNQVGAKTSQPLTQLVVYYPATSVKLTTGTTTVSVGASVTFTCTSTGGHPRHNVLVIFDVASGRVWKESVQSGSATLTYGPVTLQKSANGAKYRCKAKVNVGAVNVPVIESNTLTMDVQFPPNDIKAPADVTLDEGQSTTVQCETTTSSNPKTELTWTGPAVSQSSESTSPGANGDVNTVQPVTLTGDRTRNGATYTCTATYLGQPIYTKSTKLDVNFAPKAIAFYDTLDTPILENQTRVLRCRAETSKPPGTIIWRKNLNGNPSVIPAGPPTEVPGDFGGTVLETEITIQPSRQDNVAKYWCEVDYTYKNGTKVTRRAPAKVLEVYYRVDVGITVSPPNTNNITEGDPITLTCETSGGNPQTIDKYKWRYNGNILVNATDSTLSLNPIQHDQGGNYSCSATNKGGSSNTSIDIDVKFKPRLDPSVGNQLELAAGVGETITFSLTILANPAPTTAKCTKADSPGDLPLERFIVSNDTAAQVCYLTVKDITRNDFASYQFTVTNTIGSATFTLHLRAETNPETPIDFKIVDRSNTTLTLQWKSQFSGATSQTFELEKVDPEFKRYETEEAVTEIEKIIEYKVENLDPGTKYRFQLRSKNNLKNENLQYSEYTDPPVEKETKETIPESIEFVIKPGDEEGLLTIRWPTTVEGIDLLKDYKDATVVVTQGSSRKRRSISGNWTAPFKDGEMTFNVTNPEYANYDIKVMDADKLVLYKRNLKVKKTDDGQPPDITGAVAGVVVCFIIILVLVIVIVVLLHRKGIVGGHAKKEAPVPTDQVEGTTNPGYLGSIDSEVPQVHVSTPAISPYVVFPTQMRPKRTSMVDKVKQRLSTVSTKSDEKASHYAEARVGLAAESNYAEASFSEKPAPSNGAPAAKTKRGFNFFKGKGKKGQGSPASNKAFADLNGGTPGESSTDEISPYGTTNAYRDDISPYGTTNAYHDDISPYGTTNAPVEDISPYGTTNMFQPRPGPSAGAPLYAEVNKKRPAAPLYAEVDKTKKNNPMPVYAQVNKSGGGPPEPLYAAVDKGKKAPPAPPMYASVDTSRKRRPVPQDDAVMYAEINQDLINGRPDPSNDTYANLGSMPGERPEPTYANLSDMPPQRPEQPTTHVGVDGIIYTELIKKPEPPPGKPKPKPKPKPEETIYAEIDPTKSKPQ